MSARSNTLRASIVAGFALAVAATASPSLASVNYHFTFLDNPGTGFDYTAADFLTADANVPAAGLNSCTVPFSTCTEVDFHISTVGFVSGPDDVADVIGISVPGGTGFHYFADGAFGAAGVYDSIFLDDHTRLAVTQTSTGAPEPAAWALMLIGFAGLGSALRRHRGLSLSVS